MWEEPKNNSNILTFMNGVRLQPLALSGFIEAELEAIAGLHESNLIHEQLI